MKKLLVFLCVAAVALGGLSVFAQAPVAEINQIKAAVTSLVNARRAGNQTAIANAEGRLAALLAGKTAADVAEIVSSMASDGQSAVITLVQAATAGASDKAAFAEALASAVVASAPAETKASLAQAVAEGAVRGAGASDAVAVAQSVARGAVTGAGAANQVAVAAAVYTGAISGAPTMANQISTSVVAGVQSVNPNINAGAISGGTTGTGTATGGTGTEIVDRNTTEQVTGEQTATVGQMIATALQQGKTAQEIAELILSRIQGGADAVATSQAGAAALVGGLAGTDTQKASFLKQVMAALVGNAQANNATEAAVAQGFAAGTVKDQNEATAKLFARAITEGALSEASNAADVAGSITKGAITNAGNNQAAVAESIATGAVIAVGDNNAAAVASKIAEIAVANSTLSPASISDAVAFGAVLGLSDLTNAQTIIAAVQTGALAGLPADATQAQKDAVEQAIIDAGQAASDEWTMPAPVS